MQASQYQYDKVDVVNVVDVVDEKTAQQIQQATRRKNRRKNHTLSGIGGIGDVDVRTRRVELIDRLWSRVRDCLQRWVTISFIEYCALIASFLTCAVFCVCAVLMAQLNHIEPIRSDPTFYFIAIGTFGAWFGVICVYVFIVWLYEISNG